MDNNHQSAQPPPSYEQATSSSHSHDAATHNNKHNLPGTVPIIVQPPNVTVHNMYATTPQTVTTIETPRTIIISQSGGPQALAHVVQQYVPFGPDPVYMTCPVCHVRKLTRIEYEPDMRTHLMAGILCLLGLWCCACFPYCVGSCMNAMHYCAHCNAYLGCYNQN